MMGFQCLDPQYPDSYNHIYPIVNSSIFNIQRGNFNEFRWYESSGYDPPPLEVYTKFSLQTYFFVFWGIIILQCLCILLIDKFFVKSIPKNITLWKSFIHACQKSHFPFPYENWHEAEGTCLDHLNRKNAGQLEVLLSIAVNLVFNMILLFPLIILCKFYLWQIPTLICKKYFIITDITINERHNQLDTTIGFLKSEMEALERARLFAWVFFPTWIFMAILQAISFMLYNGRFHPLAKLLDGCSVEESNKIMEGRNLWNIVLHC